MRRHATPLLLALFAASPAAAQDEQPAPATSQVVSVYDGDTFTLSNGDKVRVRWINTPELKPAQAYGEDARELTEDFVIGESLDLTYGEATRDGYGRLLAGVWVDGRSLAEALLEKGLAHLFMIPPVGDDAPLDALIAAQARARAAGVGIWSTDRYRGTVHITSFRANARGDDRENLNGEYLRVCNITAEPLDLAGYRLSDAQGSSWLMPSVTLPVGHTVKIYTGQGDDNADPAEQLTVYLDSDRPVWNNDFDRAVLYDPLGRVMDAQLYKPKR